MRFSAQQEEASIGHVTDNDMLQLRSLMVSSVEKRTKSIPFNSEHGHSGIIIMFSGGLDSTLIAALACEVLPDEIAIDLVNVSFAPATSADRFTAIFSF